MPPDSHANFAYSLVATAPSPAVSGTSLVVTAGQGALFPAVPFNATIWPAGANPFSTTAEIVRVTGISTDTLTIVRAQEGTAARTVVVGDQIAATVTAKTLTDAEGLTPTHAALIAVHGNLSGTYTPTRSAETNLLGNVTPMQCQYLQVGNTVTVSGRVTAVDPVLTATATSFELTLPVASNLGAVEDLAGVAFCGSIAGLGAEIIGSVANNTAVVRWVATDITSQDWSFVFTYQVI